ncbi:MAG TPA: hypothetical protein DD687_05130 [Verrucomicrobiales bacterium]|nr:hypothetical protein [Verrucomicrobiales bacterium]
MGEGRQEVLWPGLSLRQKGCLLGWAERLPGWSSSMRHCWTQRLAVKLPRHPPEKKVYAYHSPHYTLWCSGQGMIRIAEVDESLI